VRTAPDGDAFTDAIERETLRLRPAVHSVVRHLTRPTTIAGHELPAGVSVMVPMVLVHRDPTAFPDPDAFRPQRFFGGGGDGGPLLPFGGGARRCLGEPLAHAMIGMVLPTVLNRVRLKAVTREPERMVVRGTVLAPHRSGLVTAA
jgi:cytochrome P450